MSDYETDRIFLKSLGNGGLRPTAAELADAPFLDRWSVENFGLLGHRVVGHCTDHPLLGTQVINTSNPVAADLDAGWMHTQSRLYRLGVHGGDR